MTNIEEIVELIRSGECNKDTLYKKIKPFLDFQENKYKGFISGGSFECGDIKSLVWLGVEYAIETFHKEKNCKFLTWASTCIKYIFMNEHKKTQNREIPFDILTESGEELSMEEMIADDSALDSFNKIETKIDGKRAIIALKSLTEEERKIIIMTCIKDIPLAKTARGMGISPSRARTLRLTALQKLKTMLLQ